jgi:hypothetical protein
VPRQSRHAFFLSRISAPPKVKHPDPVLVCLDNPQHQSSTEYTAITHAKMEYDTKTRTEKYPMLLSLIYSSPG